MQDADIFIFYRRGGFNIHPKTYVLVIRHGATIPA